MICCKGNTVDQATNCTDVAGAYRGILRPHATVSHGAGLYIGEGGESTNSIESIRVESGP